MRSKFAVNVTILKVTHTVAEKITASHNLNVQMKIVLKR